MSDLCSARVSYDNFITKHCWERLELNVTFLLQMTLEGNSHLISLCSSQVCKLKRVKSVQNWMGSLLKNDFEFNPQHILRATSNFADDE